MCCFSGRVDWVGATRIFARTGQDGHQFIVYQMSYSAKEDLAMILPLPVAKGTSETSVSFVDLSGYASFFDDVERGFPRPRHITIGIGCSANPPVATSVPLKVVSVGDYEASYVPTVNDFSRLDERFRLPAATWDKLPAYKSYGFAVFKLRQEKKQIGSPEQSPFGKQAHPMAFSFPTAYPRVLFFPTVHIHDGKVHETAMFDHLLYCQPATGRSLNSLAWKESPKLAKEYMKVEKTKSLIAGDQHCYRLEMSGELANRDVTVAVV